MSRARSSRVVLGLACLLLAACSAILSVPASQCASADECRARGFAGGACVDGICVVASASGDAGDAIALDPMWGCVGKIEFPPEDPTRTVLTSGKIARLFSDAPIAGLAIQLCRGIDARCASPVLAVTTDAEGFFSARIPYAFRGYLESLPTPAQEVLPLLMPFTVPQTVDNDPNNFDPSNIIHASSASDLGSLMQIIDKTLEPERGHLFALALDCQDNPVQGLSLEVTPRVPETVAYYTDDNRLPNLTQKATSGRGEVGYVNLPAGPVTLRYSAGGRLVGSTTVQVRKATITTIGLTPTPLIDL